MFCSQQDVTFSGQCNLTHNFAGTAGGAIYAIESTLSLCGGGIYLSHITFMSHPLGSIAATFLSTVQKK